MTLITFDLVLPIFLLVLKPGYNGVGLSYRAMLGSIFFSDIY